MGNYKNCISVENSSIPFSDSGPVCCHGGCVIDFKLQRHQHSKFHMDNLQACCCVGHSRKFNRTADNFIKDSQTA